MQDGSVSPIGNFFRNKWVRAILAVDILAIIGIVTVVIYNLTKNAIIDFTIAPIDATITVNGNSNYHNGSFQFHPGTYEVTISHESLDPKTFIIELQPDSDVAITTFLSEDGIFDFYKLKDNYSSYLMLERIASPNNNQTTDHDTSAEEFILQQEQKNSISEFTPIRFAICENPATRVNCDAVEVTYDYSEKCDNQKCLIIKGRKEELTNDVITELTNQLSSRGYNLDNYRYIYEQDTEI
ncbi:hypothetical protein [Candidatus Nanosyncoccus alces]|uniref:Uncharacterized protein n=1 Tax=Candidatus Nanosyncoccus alces TaxID=2171997 RepID=A0ABY0FP86_9BACT|nr:hypothetical protein [Candidatus Nanosyncoccus alces]RYC75003.1 hypothetical protein G3RUM_00284 [Candidatus Nanosyncoccus alces]